MFYTRSNSVRVPATVVGTAEDGLIHLEYYQDALRVVNRYGCVYKVTVAIDSLGNIVWICPLALGTSAGVLIWDREGPKRSKGHYMDYEIGSMDGAYKGRLHVAWPFICRKTLTERQKEYNDVHGFYRARIEHLFARMWH